MARILLLSDEEAIGLLWCAAAGGHDIVVAGVRSRNQLVAMSPQCGQFVELPESTSYNDKSEFLKLAELIADLAERLNIDVIVPTSFESIKFAVEMRDLLCKSATLVPLSTMEIIGRLDDKFSFYNFCLEHGLPHPVSCLLKSRADIDGSEICNLSYPLLTKPIMGVGEQGIYRFDSPAQLRKKLSSLSDDYFPVIAQEWIDGEDIDFNGYALDGEVAVSSVMRTHVHRPGSREIRLTEFVKHDAISKLGHELVEKSGFTGPLNVDLRIRKSDGKVFFIEVNPRFWARSVDSLIDGLNFVDAGIRLTEDRSWRAASRCDGHVWATSTRQLLLDAVTGDRTAFNYLKRISAMQFRFQFSKRMLALRVWMRGRQLRNS